MARQHASPLLPSESVSLEIVLGRLQLAQRRFRIQRKHERPEKNGGIERSICVSAENGRPALHFLQKDSTESWRVDVHSTGEFNWKCEYVGKHEIASVSYAQPASGEITVRIQSETKAIFLDLKARSLWHFAADCPAGFSEYVVPCLTRLDPSWDFAAMIADVNEVMIEPQLANATSIQDSVQTLVNDLGSSQIAKREVARSRLEEFGLSAWIPLEKCQKMELSPQQRRSVNGLLESMRPDREDAPTRVALWLRGDPDYCQRLVAR